MRSSGPPVNTGSSGQSVEVSVHVTSAFTFSGLVRSTSGLDGPVVSQRSTATPAARGARRRAAARRRRMMLQVIGAERRAETAAPSRNETKSSQAAGEVGEDLVTPGRHVRTWAARADQFLTLPRCSRRTFVAEMDAMWPASRRFPMVSGISFQTDVSPGQSGLPKASLSFASGNPPAKPKRIDIILVSRGGGGGGRRNIHGYLLSNASKRARRPTR